MGQNSNNIQEYPREYEMSQNNTSYHKCFFEVENQEAVEQQLGYSDVRGEGIVMERVSIEDL